MAFKSFFRILIQSSNSTKVLMENIEEYVGYTESYLKKTPPILFENQINQTLATLSQPIPTLAQQMSAWMMTIRSERKVLDFEMKQKTKDLLKTIKLDDVIDFYKRVTLVFYLKSACKINFHNSQDQAVFYVFSPGVGETGYAITCLTVAPIGYTSFWRVNAL